MAILVKMFIMIVIGEVLPKHQSISYFFGINCASFLIFYWLSNLVITQKSIHMAFNARRSVIGVV